MGIRTVATAGGIVALLAIGWAGAGIYAGHRVESELKALERGPHSSGGTRLSFLKHERGLFNSKGRFEASLRDGCDSGEDDEFRLLIDYTVSHLPLPTSPVRFDWQATSIGMRAQDLDKIIGNAQITGQGAIAWNGGLRTDIGLPELSVRQSGSVLQFAPSVGFLKVKDKQLSFGWSFPRVVSRVTGQALEARDTVFEMDLANRFLGTGSATLTVGNLSAGFGSLEGLSVKSLATEEGDRLNMSIAPSIKKLQVGSQTLESLTLEVSAKGMETKAVETLLTILSASCGMNSLTADETQRVRQAVTALVTSGFSVGISKLAGKGADGSVEGHAMIALQPSKGGRLSLAGQLRSNGQLILTGKLMNPQQRELAEVLGVLAPQGDKFGASYEYGDGLLKVNGRTLDASGFHEALAHADTALATQMAKWEAQQSGKLAKFEVAEDEHGTVAPAQHRSAEAQTEAGPKPTVSEAAQATAADTAPLAAVTPIATQPRPAAPPPVASQSGVLYACDTTKHQVVIDRDANSNLVRYRSWNRPKERAQKPDMEVQPGEIVVEGTGACRSTTYRFKTGNVAFELSDSVACTEERPPENAVGQLAVLVGGQLKSQYWCLR